MYKLLRSVLFCFDPEWVHYFSMNGLKLLCRIGFIKKLIASSLKPKGNIQHSTLPTGRQVFNIQFPNRVGLGAGFDKNAKYLNELEALGFGFMEIGTVTPLPQAGNDKPRLFRLPKDKALINRMGFNNDGVEAVAKRLKAWQQRESSGVNRESSGVNRESSGVNRESSGVNRESSGVNRESSGVNRESSGVNRELEHSPLTTHYSPLTAHQSRLIIGGNIGKNKITPNEDAWKDYETCFTALHDHVDYFVVNVSSPNTPGLRELQEKDSLKKILTNLQSLNSNYINPKPILLKIAPDLTNEQLDDVIDLALEIKLDGLVASNTSISRDQLTTHHSRLTTIGAGGLSGLPLKPRSTEIVKYIYQKTNGKIPIIASGGIFTGEDAKEKIEAGASLVQVWTGFIYEGPGIVKNICTHLLKTSTTL